MQSFSADFTGTDGGPPSTEAYKRAVYKQPPRHFAVEVLSPQKHGNAYSYGMLISPIQDSHDRSSIISRHSNNSNGSSGSSNGSRVASTIFSTLDTSTTAPLTTDYEVWRRWEDCLYFQDLLEVEYGRMSREKRARLHAGKGVKKNGKYAHEDPIRRLHRAASFESLPPGPDPNLIAKDVHEVLPRLTKKGTLFRASKETIEQRGREFKALIEALLREGDDVPMLIQELRQLRVVRDFFGFWRRDQDRLQKQFPKGQDGGDKFSLHGRSESLGSRASSIFSSAGGTGMYFSASSLTLQLPASSVAPEQSPTHKGPRRPAFMQNGKGAMLPGPPSSSELGAGKEPASPRRRAQSSVDHPYRPSVSPSSSSALNAYLGRPPASAPPGMTFAMGVENGYNSDPASMPGSPSSPGGYWSQPSPGSPRSIRTVRSSQSQSDSRSSDVSLSGGFSLQEKAIHEAGSGPIIVSLEEGETLPLDEDDHLFGTREHGNFAPHETIETRLGRLHRLQDLIIKEEDEREIDDQRDNWRYDQAHSDYHTSGSSSGHGSGKSVELEDERHSPSQSRQTAGQSMNRLGMFFRPPSSTENDITSKYDNQIDNNAERPKSPTWSTRSQTPVSSARIAAAHADALRALTGGRSLSPTSSARHLSPSEASSRSSVLTTTSGSTNSEHARSFETQSIVDDRPYSYQSSVTSCVDIDRHLTSSPVVLHSPIEELDDDCDYSSDQRQSTSTTQWRSHDSTASVRTFMTETSMDMIIPPREQRPISPRAMHNLVTNGAPWPQQRPTSPGYPVSIRDSGMTIPSTSDSFDSRSISSISPPPTASSYAPSITSTLSEESGANAVSIKVVCGEHIVAFRIDRSSSLVDVRDKLRRKLADQQNVLLMDHFSLAYKPPGPGRVQELRKAFATGRARSSSASSVGKTDLNSLRILFSQRDWLDAVGSCPPGSKVTLHVLNR
ncbi:uncharacterized protein FOMMEDRAFT_17337 [Fomitiporia mediterranea MF3/22]|uniref:uncharacterized protein n=1 Tax=Fomitiporia mediterranea (strain MF3/22) TaxID=694068 RepID=UPI0004408201|nr:uncharacterized protein FOMMEDRAFT_17337 [Fomitiporia mediterranea MF3/22]EJD06871.1 hypothetical protein FOMMEDRAFT_17337 [Fomitiporia mediterranea MF3/22]